MTRTISMWSGPRNISTAMMYSWRQRADTVVVDEPLYGHFLRVTGRRHPGDETFLPSLDTDGPAVLRRLLDTPAPRPIRFLKNMAHHLVELDHAFLPRMDHLLLIRPPDEVIASLLRQLPDATLADTGLPQQVALLEELTRLGRPPVVIDAQVVRVRPEAALRAMCAALDLPFDLAMLSWPAGPKPEDGPWAPWWYAGVHKSSGFDPPRRGSPTLPMELLPLLQACRPLYVRLQSVALRG